MHCLRRLEHVVWKISLTVAVHSVTRTIVYGGDDCHVLYEDTRRLIKSLEWNAPAAVNEILLPPTIPPPPPLPGRILGFFLLLLLYGTNYRKLNSVWPCRDALHIAAQLKFVDDSRNRTRNAWVGGKNRETLRTEACLEIRGVRRGCTAIVVQ